MINVGRIQNRTVYRCHCIFICVSCAVITYIFYSTSSTVPVYRTGITSYKSPLNTMIESAELYLTSCVVDTVVDEEVELVGCSCVLMVDGVVAAVVVVT